MRVEPLDDQYGVEGGDEVVNPAIGGAAGADNRSDSQAKAIEADERGIRWNHLRLIAMQLIDYQHSVEWCDGVISLAIQAATRIETGGNSRP